MKEIIIFSTLLLTMAPLTYGNNIKSPNVSGQFYSADPKKLTLEIEKFFSKATVSPKDKHVEMIISPHAGYVYSGGVAAYGFKSLSQKQYKTIIILAPSHFFRFSGVSIWDKGGFKTPLGIVQVDEAFTKRLLEVNEEFYFKPEVFEREHSLEVQIPFLQKTFKDFKIVPIIMGQANLDLCQKLAQSLRDIIGEREDVLIVVSTDMSHYHDDAFARKMDAATLVAVKNLEAEKIWHQCRVGTMEMCGFIPVTTALHYAKLKGLEEVDILKYANSGDINQDKDSVVGYSSVVFSKGESSSQEEQKNFNLSFEQKKKLIEIARSTIEMYIRTGKEIEFKENDPRLNEKQGAFVTLRKGGQLRGCIGNIISDAPLYLTVRDMAISSATQDHRFLPVKKDELKDIEIEVSVLSQPKQIFDVNQIELGVHGVIISKGFLNRGVFLPEVATDQGWNREQFLSYLCAHKANLPADAWKDPETKIEVFTTESFSEKDLLE